MHAWTPSLEEGATWAARAAAALLRQNPPPQIWPTASLQLSAEPGWGLDMQLSGATVGHLTLLVSSRMADKVVMQLCGKASGEMRRSALSEFANIVGSAFFNGVAQRTRHVWVVGLPNPVGIDQLRTWEVALPRRVAQGAPRLLTWPCGNFGRVVLALVLPSHGHALLDGATGVL